MTLRNKTYSAVRWTATTAVIRACLQLAQIVVLARLLEPADFGLMAIVAVVIGFVSLTADAGINSAYLQRQNVSAEDRSSLYWLNVLIGGALSLLLALASPLLAMLFGDPRLTPLIMLASGIFFVTSLGQQLRITAEKELEFRPVAFVELSATSLGFAVALLSAFSGLGVYSLVLAALTTAAAGSAFSWFFLANGWRPLLRLRIKEIRSYLGFGGTLVANNLVNEFNRSMDLLLGGRLLTATALGLYSLPRQLVFQIQGLVNPIITRISFPLIAKIQNDIPRVRSAYLQSLNMVASTNAPVYLGIAFFAPEVVALLFGEKWQDTAAILQILAVWGGIRTLGNPVGALLLGLGRADLSLKWNLALLLIVPPALWAGSHYGLIGIAWTLLAMLCVLFVPGWYFLVRPLCHARLLEYSDACFRAFLIALASIAPVAFFCDGIENPLLHLMAAIVLTIPLYLALSYRFNRAWLDALMQLLKVTR